MAWSSTVRSSGTPNTATPVTPGKRRITRSTGAAEKFSPSTRSQSALRPAK